MSPVWTALDAGVVIERVRVRVRPSWVGAPAAPEPRRGLPARASDHRIVLRELQVDTDAEIEAFEARRLGERVARALADELLALQQRRVDAIRAGRTRGGPVHVGALRAVLRGAEAEKPDVRAIGSALASAVQRRLSS